MNLLRVAVMASVLSMAGCGNEDQDTATRSSDTGAVASFWTLADYRMQRIASVTIPGDWQSLEKAVEAGGLFGRPASFVQRETYDGFNRLARSEIRVFPKASNSALSVDGSLALLVDQMYPSETSAAPSSVVVQVWDNWWDGATGRLQEKILWTDQTLEDGTLTARSEEFVSYNTDSDSQAIASTRSTASRFEYNAQHLVVERHIDADGDSANGFEQVELWRRYRDGRLRNVINASGVTVASYDYDSSGALTGLILYSDTGTKISHQSFRYRIIDGHYALVIEKHTRRGSVEGYETEVRLYEEKACHPSTKHALRFSRPENGACADATAWRGVVK